MTEHITAFFVQRYADDPNQNNLRLEPKEQSLRQKQFVARSFPIDNQSTLKQLRQFTNETEFTVGGMRQQKRIDPPAKQVNHTGTNHEHS